MTKTFNDHLENLKTALLSLKPTGSDGFEGLLAVVLTKIVGHPFRLAGAGSQHGKDGDARFDTGQITFEGKLYSGKINKNEVLSKLTEIIGGGDTPDIWILGATIEIKTQILDPLMRAAEKNAISAIILDWPTAVSIPPLAALCAMSKAESIAFLDAQVSDIAKVAMAKAALTAIRAHPDFSMISGGLKESLSTPTIGIPLAVEANRDWLSSAFSNKKLARQVFGQPLAPSDDWALAPQMRPELKEKTQRLAFKSIAEEIVVLCGSEGCGKSWLFAQSWQSLEDRPLTIVIPAADLQLNDASSNPEAFLIKQLIKQTDQQATSFTEARWRKRFLQWTGITKKTSPQIVVFVDGLNQRPEFEWARWLDGLSYLLERIGGRLVISIREGYFNGRVKNSLATPFKIVAVKEWSQIELTTILSAMNFEAATLNRIVLKTLQNPRILGIACELLKSEHIKGFEELSVERLLFEHIRTSARTGNSSEPVAVFIRRLSSHAKEITDRVEKQCQDDRLIFESADVAGAQRYELSTDLLAVSEGRFFNQLTEDPTLYTLSDEGLIFALGLSIINSLQQAERNNRNIDDTLDIILEPIAALDKTAEAVFASVLISSIDEGCTDSIKCSLICGYLRLQNISEHTFPAFCSVVRHATEAAMQALFALANSPLHTEHEDWLIAALREQRDDAKCWRVMVNHLKDWLCLYSLDPELKVWKRHQGSSEEKIAEEKEKRGMELDKRLSELSAEEASFLAEKMRRDDAPSASSYGEKAFSLMVGMPLAEFAGSLVAWAFSQSLNSDFHSPYDEFQFLIQFNCADWKETREALLRHASIFQNADTSRTGKWALVLILRATSSEIDAKSEEKLVAELTADREQFESWRLVERYCASDPCDPTSLEPDNISDTVNKFREIELDKVHASRHRGQEDLFLSMACPGVARFAPNTAIEVKRQMNENLLSRDTGGPLLQFHSIKSSAALLTKAEISKLGEIATELSGPYPERKNDDNGRWVKSQYGLLLMLPHLSGNEQLQFLMSLPQHGPPLLDLADVLKPASTNALESAFDRCAQSDDVNLHMTVLMFARYSGSSTTPRSRRILKALVDSPKSATRGQAMNLIAYLKDRQLVKHVADSGWTAALLDPRESFYERRYGAQILADAVMHGDIETSEALDRITPEYYGFVASVVDAKEKHLIFERLNASVEMALDADLPFVPPTVEQKIDDGRKAFDPPLLSLVDSSDGLSINEFFKRMSEEPEDFDARQDKGWEAFRKFEDSLTKQKANLIVEHASYSTIKACVESAPEAVRGWVESFLKLPDPKLMRVQNFGLVVAECLSQIDAELAEQLFRRLTGGKGYVNLVSGIAALPAESLYIWRSADSLGMNELRQDRLDNATNDDAIAVEVLCAIHSKKNKILNDYMQDRLSRDEPAKIARALMVCGFGLDSEEARNVLSKYDNKKGLIGKAAATAKFAYERNVWSKTWFSRMADASSNEDFWLASVQFSKIVDARYEDWNTEFEIKGEPCNSFLPLLRSEIEKRIKSWQNERRKTLFGNKAPRPIFVDAS